MEEAPRESSVSSAIPLVDLKRQYAEIRREIAPIVEEVIRGGTYILGPNTSMFEKEFASYCQVRYGVAVASGTDALLLSLKACEVGEGDEVITSAHTFIATLDAIVRAGAKPILVDIDPLTYTIDVSKVKAKVTDRTKAVIPVHLYGHSADLAAIQEIADAHGIRVIEDACQAHGTLYKGRRVGGVGSCGCFSFYPSKTLGAYGDAGIVVTNDSTIADGVRMLRSHGQPKKYEHQIKGFNSRMDEIQAAVLCVKMKHLDGWIQRRRKLASEYDAALAGVEEIVKPFEAEYTTHSYSSYVVRAKRRDALKQELSRRGVETAVYYPTPVHLTDAYRDLGLGPGSFPVTESCSKEVLSLPVSPELRVDEVHTVSGIVRAFYEARTGT